MIGWILKCRAGDTEDLQITEKPCIPRANYKLFLDFLTAQRVGAPNLHVIQGSIYYINEFPNIEPTLYFRIKLYLDMMHYFLNVVVESVY